jgi:hypothetical protein
MSQLNEMPTTDFFEKFIKEYGRAWDNYDLQTILRFYYTPCFIFKSGTVFANVTEEIKELYFRDLLEAYRQQGYAIAEVLHSEVKSLGQDSTLVTVEWVCKRADATVAFDFWDSYHLIHINSEWKILGDTVYDR